MMNFKRSRSEIRIYKIFSDNKLDGMYVGELYQHNSLISFSDDAEIFYSIF